MTSSQIKGYPTMPWMSHCNCFCSNYSIGKFNFRQWNIQQIALNLCGNNNIMLHSVFSSDFFYIEIHSIGLHRGRFYHMRLRFVTVPIAVKAGSCWCLSFSISCRYCINENKTNAFIKKMYFDLRHINALSSTVYSVDKRWFIHRPATMI